MYSFVTGPFLWLTFILFIGGSIFRIAEMLKLAQKDKVIYPYLSLKYGLRSVIHWLLPFGSRNMQLRPVMTVVTFAFHICLVITPLLFVAHIVYWHRSWNVSWWSLPALLADIMTIIVIAGSLFFLIRRLVLPEVKNVTSWGDYTFLLVIVFTFASGFITHHQLFWYNTMFTLHILSGGIMLMAIPFSRLSHMLYFIFTRAYMGAEFGYVRNSKDW